MRILHTADWHIGRTLRGRSRAAEHESALAEIARIAAEREVDLVIVAGDVFDASAPTAESEEIAYRGLLALARTGARVVVIGGNHDHPRRLEAVRPLLDLGDVTVLAAPARPDAGGVLDVRARSGEPARLALLPFLSQRGIIRADELMAGDAATREQTYAARYRRIVEALTSGFGDDAVNIVVGHGTVVGARMGGGEREAHTIFDYAVPSQVFPASAHYVALGHVHRAQQLPAGCPVWYCGAPFQLDFGEAGNEGRVLIVEAAPGVPARVEEVPLTAGRPLRTLRGTLEQLTGREADAGDAFLRIIIEEPARAGMADEVRAQFGNAVDIAVAPPEPDVSDDEEISLESMRSAPVELFAEYLRHQKLEDPALLELFRTLLEDAVAPDAARG